MKLALYKGESIKFYKRIPQKLIRFWTRSKYSHAELIIGDMWYSSSASDGGVRCKNIKFIKERWDVFELDCDDTKALEWFNTCKGHKYDYAGVARFVIPFLPNSSDKWFCFEAVGAMIGIEDTSKLTGKHLEEFVSSHSR